ncbi:MULTISPECIES: DUF1161 domain-containing protein [Pseudomonas]|uniref:DUF1161 domain-containing protein n=1 Tax=Pseudomonas fluorescens R124 TaxID=743713 RepID=A0A7U9CIJ0_PSEFL|nr:MULTISPECIES: DUF1161 domain-containing protein [Pseudomonas]EJZ55845.1 hypothetical protein I1A_000148 [Pseudomonas fluorescens R124]MCU1775005.1 DUF1161 domain-containing protein [Pseudomonas sp. 13B_3.2_Bac1]RBB98590.1 DUF1161 domain-containing protein [Pseudomonas sp. MWU12-2115]
MKKFILAVGLLSLAGGAFAAGKSCDQLEKEIKDKLEAKGVHGYALQIVDKGSNKGADGKTVGSCDGGKKEIVYKRH